MDQNQIGRSFFPSSQVLITGGTFTSHITYSQNVTKSGYERLLKAVAPNALHNSGHVFDPPKCHPGTRVAVMRTILDWMGGRNDETREKGITWLSGAAGAGKSAIGRSVCERCAEKGMLLASFFFGSGDPSRNHPGSLVATIAYQICSISPAVRDVVSAFIDHDPLIFNRSIRTQFSSLVIDPLSAIYANEPQKVPPLIVIDGLDECLDTAGQRDILECLLDIINTSHIAIRILVCSRPESQITNSFDAARMTPVVFKIYLGDKYSPDEDIRLYLHDRFAEIRQSHNLRSLIPASWPAQPQVDEIVSKSSGQFIFAATVVRYVESSRHRPHQRLEAALGIRPPFKDLPFSELDALYTHILMLADEPSLVADILAFPAIYMHTPLADIERYLDLEVGDVQVMPTDLRSIVRIHSSPLGVHTIFLLHKSFSDFLFDSQRSKHLYKDRIETRARHITRVIQMFSEKDEERHFKPENYSYSLTFYIDNDIHYEDWSHRSQKEFLDVITHFPLQSFCQAVRLQKTKGNGYGDYTFLSYFFRLLDTLDQHTQIRKILQQHVQTFCEYALSELCTTYCDHLEMNYIFAMRYLAGTHRLNLWDNNALGDILRQLSTGTVPGVPRTFLLLLDDTKKARIIAKAAAYCVDYACGVSSAIARSTKSEARRHLQLGWMDAKKRKTRPWRWLTRWNRHLFEKRPVLLRKGVRERRISYGDIIDKKHRGPFPIYSFESFDWDVNGVSDNEEAANSQAWFHYMSLLENMCIYLPLAARYTPLIDLCKTKVFAPMSMESCSLLSADEHVER